jgi:ABC-type branched-subunit amino acid transport system ATPase component
VAVLQALQRHTGALLVLVDHDMDLVRATCDRAAVLDFGRVIAHGPPGDVLADPDVRRVYFGEDL